MTTLRALQTAGALPAVAVHMATALTALADESDLLVQLGAAAAARAPLRGHVCADLATLAGQPIRLRDGSAVPDASWPALAPWRAALDHSALTGDGAVGTPLVLDGDKLYLHRFWAHQRALAAALEARIDAPSDPLDRDLLRAGLVTLFGPPDPSDLQRAGAAVCARSRFTVISGGPGTGKTYTVLRILALLQQQAVARGGPLRIELVAPTGKAAARLRESIEAGRSGLPEHLQDTIPTQARTIHRALGVRPDTPTQFRHNAERPLAADVVVVDEASMVDLALLRALVDAVPPAAKLILLGDRDQLASVEAGALLGDICNAGGTPRGWSSSARADLADLLGAEPDDGLSKGPAGIQDHIVHLRHSRRFGPDSGIGALARAINDGDAVGAIHTLRDPQRTDVELLHVANGLHLARTAAFTEQLLQGFGPVARATDPARALEALGTFRVLAAHRRGHSGVQGLNRLSRDVLAQAGLIDARAEWYAGRPVMVRRNDYALRLFNGDVGVALPDESGALRVWFAGDDGPRPFHPARLPPHETVFATTVHKSQGSEFDRVLLVLPDQASPILTRELLYTAITRARTHACIVGTTQVLALASETRIQRSSGMRDRLWGA
jgi:exodeoxyribonuclease V alpha subunit